MNKKEYYLKNKDKIKQYYKDNREKILKYQSNYNRQKYIRETHLPVIYQFKFKHKDRNYVYIGSTTNLSNREKSHKILIRRMLKGDFRLSSPYIEFSKRHQKYHKKILLLEDINNIKFKVLQREIEPEKVVELERQAIIDVIKTKNTTSLNVLK